MATGNRKRMRKTVKSAPVLGDIPAWMRSDWFWALILVAAIFAVYQPVWTAGFVWDDEVVLRANPCIVGPLGLKEIWTTSAADICPLTITTFWLEHALWGLRPLPYHLVTLVLYGGCALMLWRVLRSLNVPGAWLGTALWALHPVQVESVAWVSETKNTESGLFFLVSLFFFIRGLKEKVGWRYALSLIFAALAVTSKSSTAILPVVQLLSAWWIEGRWNRIRFLQVIPLILISLAAVLLSIWTQNVAGAEQANLPAWSHRIAIAGYDVWFYLGKLVWPWPLMAIYPKWHGAGTTALSYLPALAAVALLVALGWKRNSGARPAFFAYVYFLVAILPVLGFISLTYFIDAPVADHLQFLAGMGPMALVGAGLVKLKEAGMQKVPWLPSTLGAGLLAILALASWNRAWAFEDTTSLWTDTLAKNPASWEGHNNLGTALEKAGRLDQAEDEYEKALRLNPDSARAHNNLGFLLAANGRLDPAIEQYQMAIKLDPDDALAYSNLGVALARKGDLTAGIAECRKATQCNPNLAAAHGNLGNLLAQANQLDAAMSEYRKALNESDNDASTYNNVGNIELQKGDVDASIAAFQNALKIMPASATIHFNLGNAYLKKGESQTAILQFQEALRLQPDLAPARENLEKALATQKGTAR